MGICLHAVHILANTLPVVGTLREKTVLTLGVQDCFFTYKEIVHFFERHRIPYTPLNSDQVQLTTGFKWVPVHEREKYRQCIHQNTLFRLLGFRPEHIHAMDIDHFEGADILHDLNVPVRDSLRSRFDVIYDGGTIEHVFSTKDALFNICQMSTIGGLVIDVAPCDWINHGLINFNAEMFRDCFGINGFEEIFLKYISRPRVPVGNKHYYLEFRPETFHWSLQPYYLTEVFSIFRKTEERPLRIPQQGFYRNLWSNKTVAGPGEKNGIRKFLEDKGRDLVDRSFFLSTLIRDYRAVTQATKVSL